MTVVEIRKFPKNDFFSGCNDFKHTGLSREDNLSVMRQVAVNAILEFAATKGVVLAASRSIFAKSSTKNEVGMSNGQWLEREKAVLTPASHRSHDPKFGPVFCRGLGARLWDVGGEDYIDFTCGYSASNFGHCFPPLVEVARNQLGQLTHLTQEPHVWRAPLAEKLIEICGFEWANGQGEAKVHFNASGSRAVETAWKAAFAFRPGRLISLAPGYHGRSLATSALSDSAPGSMLNFVPPSLHQRRAVSEFAYCAACPHNLKFPNCRTRCLDELVDQI